ncbi:MAG: hypothetical protein QOC83_5059 [Pseudonocardiales bacterium]|nr:hypothetical protein [Pseudonocardiales bacterium]
MVSAAAAGGIGLVALGLVLTPGPNMIYLVSRSITQGRRAGLVSLLGVAVGFLAYLAAATAGLAAIFTAVPAAYAALKIAGALYLLYLAWQALRPGGTPVFAPRPLPPDRAVGGHAVPGAGPPPRLAAGAALRHGQRAHRAGRPTAAVRPRPPRHAVTPTP